MLSIGKKVDDPVAWNKKQNEVIQKIILSGYGTGCISTKACEGCGHLITDSVCLCVGIFTCPNCGYENGQETKKQLESA